VNFVFFVVKKPTRTKKPKGNHMKGYIQFEKLSKAVIGCAIEVHRELGPGLLESAYEQCLAHELRLKGIQFELQKVMPVEYKGTQIDCGYRLDLLVEGQLIVELKAVAAIEPIHKAQILTYLKLARARTGLLINFNVPLLKDGIQRFVL
jgi:GxxExxY protein